MPCKGQARPGSIIHWAAFLLKHGFKFWLWQAQIVCIPSDQANGRRELLPVDPLAEMQHSLSKAGSGTQREEEPPQNLSRADCHELSSGQEPRILIDLSGLPSHAAKTLQADQALGAHSLGCLREVCLQLI